MPVVIDNDEYGEIRKDSLQREINREYKSDGIHRYVVNFAGGIPNWVTKVTPWGEKEDIQFCSQCGESMSRHSSNPCFGCAMGL